MLACLRRSGRGSCMRSSGSANHQRGLRLSSEGAPLPSAHTAHHLWLLTRRRGVRRREDGRGHRGRVVFGLGHAADRAAGLAAINHVLPVILAGLVRAVPVAWPTFLLLHRHGHPTAAAGHLAILLRRLQAGLDGVLWLVGAADRACHLVTEDDVAAVVLAGRIRAMPVAGSRDRHRRTLATTASTMGLEAVADSSRARIRHCRTLRVQRRPDCTTACALHLAPVHCVPVIDTLRVRATPIAWFGSALPCATSRAVDLASEHELRRVPGVVDAGGIWALPVARSHVAHR